MKMYLQDAMLHWHIVAFLTVAAIIIAASFYALAGKPAGQVPIVGGDTNQIVVAPASGVAGFDVAAFCADPLTTVKAFLAPDASGTTYQLTRTRDGKAESVTAVLAPDGSVKVATHYYETNLGQQSEVADLTAAAQSCIQKKAKG